MSRHQVSRQRQDDNIISGSNAVGNNPDLIITPPPYYPPTTLVNDACQEHRVATPPPAYFPERERNVLAGIVHRLGHNNTFSPRNLPNPLRLSYPEINADLEGQRPTPKSTMARSLKVVVTGLSVAVFLVLAFYVFPKVVHSMNDRRD